MLNCRACLWRCIQALDAPAANAIRGGATAELPLLPRRSRHLYTLTRDDTSTLPSEGAEIARLRKTGQEPWSKSGFAQNQKKRERAALRSRPAADERTPNLERIGRRDPRISEKDWDNRKRELRHLQDPLELATFVKKELEKGKVTEMLQLVRMASQSMQCIVSYNHIIDHYLANQKVNDALKVYNDMKKRAQFPDSYTYTILLRGLSMNAHTSGVLEKALSIYHSLSAPNCRVEPSIIHTNATLKVCARSMDMDALWGIAGKIPETGPASPNVVTYITILNAIRQNLLLGGPEGETESGAAARKDRGIMEGRRMWEEIVAKWRNADVRIDEELVCAMGRLLLLGSRPRDWDDVLSLVEQTMDIPRLIPRLGSAERQEAGHPRVRAPNVPPEYRFDDDHLAPNEASMRGDEFLPLVPQGVASAFLNPLSYVKPGNNILSVLQEACQKTAALKAAQEYWEMLTDPGTYNVTPDIDNLHTRLRVLRQNRASTAAVQLLKNNMLGKGVVPKPGTFRIVASTCVRDKNNHNSLRNAGQVLQIMLETQEDVDPKTVGMYCDLALSFPLAKGSDLMEALTLLYPIVKNIRLQLGVGRERRYGRLGAVYLYGPQRQDALLVLRKIYAVYDRLILSNMIPEEQKPPFKTERAVLGSFINRLNFKDQDRNERRQRPELEKDLGEADEHNYLQPEPQDNNYRGRRKTRPNL